MRRRVRRSDYLSNEDYQRACHEAGEIAHTAGGGYYGRLNESIWGRSSDKFADGVMAEAAFEQRNRPHVFVRKWR